MRRDEERISDILEACARIEQYVESKSAVDFFVESLLQDAVMRQLTIVGEVAVSLSAEFKAGHPGIPWPEIAGFRNRIVHDYFGFNLDTASMVATKSLPILREQLTTILNQTFPDESL